MDANAQRVHAQICAMGAEVFEVGLFKPAAREGQAVMIPRTWDAATLTRSIGWLRLQNADGRNIYIRPKGEHDLSLVDDLSADAIKVMRASGFAPAVIVETSPNNFQAWLKHPCTLPREVSTLAARTLAERFGGDKGAADWRHFGRLASFTNRKEKYINERGLFPFVRLIEASGQPYPAGERFIATVFARHASELRSREHQRRPSPPTNGRHLKTIDEFRSDPRYGGDATREDLAFAIYALSHGAGEAAVESALHGRDLSHKGDKKRQDQYIQRTLSKASRVAEARCRT